MEWESTDILNKLLRANAVLVPKGRRVNYGSHDYLRNFNAATTPLKNRFGVSSHFVNSCDGEVESGDQSKHQFIQETFILNIVKVAQSNIRMEQYNMKPIFMVLTLKNKFAKDPAQMFDLKDVQDLFLHWDKLKWDDIKA